MILKCDRRGCMNKSLMAVFFLVLSATPFDVIHAGPNRTEQTQQEAMQLSRNTAQQARHG